MALGADGARILRMVMRQGAWQLAIGLFLGVSTTALLLSLIGAEALRNFLFRVDMRDTLWIYSAVAALLSAVAAASVFVPARRATRVNPIVALRAE
jgi:ABC-type antimicrobial peptide transport system permease subunit